MEIMISPACIRRLRQKIERDPDRPAFLHTVRGYGGRLTMKGGGGV
ncbi:MAG: helix-turn-helix domain-containing protein [Armatimonadetes bacterium]|nr:helix-turn-helix domain-containing protein [Armatimonadota bacterium]